MKKNLLFLLCLSVFSLGQAQNVPNGGFETWAQGDPTNWSTSNIPTVAIPVTQATPSHSGNFAVKGEVINYAGNPISPYVESTVAGNGFAVTQAYSTLTFWYKSNLLGANALNVIVAMNDASNNTVGIGIVLNTSDVSSFTQVNLPINYSAFNPVECVIEFMIIDTAGGIPAIGSYYIIDDVGLSGLASVPELPTSMSLENVYPNPVSNSVWVHYNLNAKSDVEFRILNIQGKTVCEVLLPGTNAGKHKMEFDVAIIPAGSYIVRMKTNQGISFSRLLIAR